MIKITDEEPTILKQELIEKIQIIKKYNIILRYFPERVEPGIKYDLEQVNKWSRFVGKTLYINDNFLSDPQLQDSIMFREALLLFAPKEMRDFWWVQVITTTYPLVVKQVKENQEAWFPFWKRGVKATKKKVRPEEFHQQVSVINHKSFINFFQECIYRETLAQELRKKSLKNQNKEQLSCTDFYLILSKIYRESTGLSKTEMEILKLALKYQTTKISELEKYSDRHSNTIWEKVNRLRERMVLLPRQFVNYRALNLIPFIAVLLASKNQTQHFYNEYPKSPFLHSQKINCFANNVITQYYLAPDSKDFRKGLLKYCQMLQENGEIYNYYLFMNHQKKAFRSYNFKDYNRKLNEHRLNIHQLFIECNHPSTWIKDSIKEEVFGNVFVKSPQQSINKIPELDENDFQILNSFIKGQPTRNEIREKLNKDLNEVVERIHKLEEQNILVYEISAIPPDCHNQLTIYSEILEKDSSQKEEEGLLNVGLKTKIKIIAKLLPHCYYSELIQPEEIADHSFEGVFLHTYLPSSCLSRFASFMDWFLPFSEGMPHSKLKRLIIVGEPYFQKRGLLLNFDRWNSGEWLVKENDFKHKGS
ncbi:MAG: hypothetical protein GF308_12395 [Candidatus Heimdallarchaeota archaeon]|nr:hypothetical protein [Candidatus Heimdallarchaeota archaeon]